MEASFDGRHKEIAIGSLGWPELALAERGEERSALPRAELGLAGIGLGRARGGTEHPDEGWDWA
jgi:hypothetical protein